MSAICWSPREAQSLALSPTEPSFVAEAHSPPKLPRSHMCRSAESAPAVQEFPKHRQRRHAILGLNLLSTFKPRHATLELSRLPRSHMRRYAELAPAVFLPRSYGTIQSRHAPLELCLLPAPHRSMRQHVSPIEPFRPQARPETSLQPWNPCLGCKTFHFDFSLASKLHLDSPSPPSLRKVEINDRIVDTLLRGPLHHLVLEENLLLCLPQRHVKVQSLLSGTLQSSSLQTRNLALPPNVLTSAAWEHRESDPWCAAKFFLSPDLGHLCRLLSKTLLTPALCVLNLLGSLLLHSFTQENTLVGSPLHCTLQHSVLTDMF